MKNIELKAVLSLRDKLSAKMKQASNSVRAMETRVTEARRQIERLSSERGLNINMRSNISEIVSQTRTEIGRLRANIESERLEIGTRLDTEGWSVEDMQQNLSQLGSFLERNEGKVEEYTQKLELLRQKQSELSDTAKISTRMGLENQIDSLQRKLTEIETAKARFAEWRDIQIRYDALEQAEAEVRTLEQAVEELSSHNVAVRAFLDFKQDALKQIYEIDEKLTALGRRIISPLLRLRDRASGPLNRVQRTLLNLGRRIVQPIIRLKDLATRGLKVVRSGLIRVAAIVAYPIVKLKDLASRTVGKIASKIKAITGKVWSTTVKAIDRASPVLKKIGSGLKSLSKLAAKGIVVGATTAVAVGTAGVSSAANKQQAVNQVLASTGYNKEDYGQEFSDIIGNLYKNNMGEDYGDLANSLSQVAQITGTTGKGLENLTHNALLLRDTFDFDVTESVRSAKMMMDQFGISGNEAYNLIAQGAQYGLNKNGDLLDTLNEYGVHFKNLGFDSTEMMNMLVNGAKSGTFSVDKLGDAIKEFGIRAKDGSDGTKQAFKDLGLDANKLTNDFAKGGATGKAAFQEVTQALANMKDPVKQNQAGVALFGTMWEDLQAEGVLAMANLTGEIQSGTAALEQLNNVKYDDIGSAFTSLKRTFQESILNPIGEALLPTVTNSVNTLRGFADQMGEAIQSGDMSNVGKVFQDMFSAGVESARDGIPKIAKTVVSGIIGLAETIQKNAPDIAKAASEIVMTLAQGMLQMVPANIQSGITIIKSLAQGIVQMIPELLSIATQVVSTLMQGFAQMLPMILEVGIQVILALIQGISQVLPELLPLAVQGVMLLVQGIASMLPTILTIGVQLIVALIQSVVSYLPEFIAAGTQMIVSLVQGIASALPIIIQTAVQLIPILIQGITSNLPFIIQSGIQIIVALIQGLASAIPTLISAIPEIFSAFISGIMSVDWIEIGIEIIKSIGTGLLDAGKSILGGVWEGIKSIFTGESKETGTQATENLASGIQSNSSQVSNAASTVANMANKGFQLDTNSIYNQGTNATNSLANGISMNSSAPFSAAQSVSAETATGFEIPDISSKGANMADSLANGITSNAGSAIGAATNMSNQVSSAASTEVNVKINADITSLESFKSQINKLATSASSSLTKLPEAFNLSMISANSIVLAGMTQIKGVVAQGIAVINSIVVTGTLMFISSIVNGCTQAVVATNGCAISIQNVFSGVNLYSSGVNMMSGLILGINSMRGAVIATATSIASAASDSINKALDIHSPSRVTKASGMFAGQGLAIGMKQSLPEVKKSAEEMANTAIPEESTYEELSIAEPVREENSSIYNNNNTNRTSKTVKKIYQIEKIIENVTVQNEADEDRLVEKIMNKLADEFDDTDDNMGEDDES